MVRRWVDIPTAAEWPELKKSLSREAASSPADFVRLCDKGCEYAFDFLSMRLTPERLMPTVSELMDVHMMANQRVQKFEKGPGSIRGLEGSPVEHRDALVGSPNSPLWIGTSSRAVATELARAAAIAAQYFKEALSATGEARLALAARAMSVYSGQLALIQPFTDGNRRFATIVATVQCELLLGKDIVLRAGRAPDREAFNAGVVALSQSKDVGPLCKVLTGIDLGRDLAQLRDSIDPCQHREVSAHGTSPTSWIEKHRQVDVSTDLSTESFEKRLPSGRSLHLRLNVNDPELNQMKAATVAPEVDRYLQMIPNADSNIAIDLRSDKDGKVEITLAKGCAEELERRDKSVAQASTLMKSQDRGPERS